MSSDDQPLDRVTSPKADEADKVEIRFGTIILDKLHMFMGVSSPTAFVVADMWGSEEYDGDCWVDHYRSHQKTKFTELRDTSKFEVLGQYNSTSSRTALEQCELLQSKWLDNNQEWVDARTELNQKRLKGKL